MSTLKILTQTLFGLILAGRTQAHMADPVPLSAFIALPRPVPTIELQYGAAQAQAIDVFVPRGKGPHPVAILIHGGCWTASAAGREQLRHLGASLAQDGIAVWSIGYRRADEAGGGFPGTYQDVGNALDQLVAAAASSKFDLSKAVVVGHSAGGHLALWAMSRPLLPSDSPLFRDKPFTPSRAVILAGIGDLQSFAPHMARSCGPAIFDALTARGSVLPQVSPQAMGAPKGSIVLLSGVLDRLVPPYMAHEYAIGLRQAPGLNLSLRNIEGAGHFDLVTPGTPAWRVVREEIDKALASPGQ